MEKNDLIRRVQDLADRCERTSCMTNTAFLTPAEVFSLQKAPQAWGTCRMVLSGGVPGCERQVAFFLPDYMDEEDPDVGSIIKAIQIQSYFGTPGHRDYLGAVLGLGIERDRIGDLLIDGDTAFVFCLSPVAPVLLRELDKVGRCGVKTKEILLSDVPVPRKQVKPVRFTVKSLRLDAVTGDLFGVSRTTAAEMIRLGLVSLNYTVCEKTDAPITEGDVISVRGKGKGRIASLGGRSRKDRLFVEAELFL